MAENALVNAATFSAAAGALQWPSLEDAELSLGFVDIKLLSRMSSSVPRRQTFVVRSFWSARAPTAPFWDDFLRIWEHHAAAGLLLPSTCPFCTPHCLIPTVLPPGAASLTLWDLACAPCALAALCARTRPELQRLNLLCVSTPLTRSAYSCKPFIEKLTSAMPSLRHLETSCHKLILVLLSNYFHHSPGLSIRYTSKRVSHHSAGLTEWFAQLAETVRRHQPVLKRLELRIVNLGDPESQVWATANDEAADALLALLDEHDIEAAITIDGRKATMVMMEAPCNSAEAPIFSDADQDASELGSPFSDACGAGESPPTSSSPVTPPFPPSIKQEE